MGLGGVIWLISNTLATDIVVLIADAVRLRAIRAVSPFPYRMLYFSDSNLESALGTIGAHAPCRIALDTQFAHNLTDGEAVSKRRFIEKIADAMGLPHPHLMPPYWLAFLVTWCIDKAARLKAGG